MKESLTVSEKYSRHWPAVAVGSAVLAVLFYILYQLSSNVLYEGYLRLTSFAFFALSILSFFKVREGKIVIDLKETGDNIVELTYKTGSRILYQEEVSINDISEIMIDEMPNRSLYNDLVKSDRCLKIRKDGSKHWIYLNSVNGRVIPLSEENASSIKSFLEAD